MKKVLIVIILVGAFLSILMIFPNKKNKNSSSKEIPYPFYKENLADRYDNYRVNNPNLEEIDVITRVNLNLDKEFYTDTKKTKFLNSIYLLVNKYNYLSSDYVPDNLEVLTDCTSKENYLVKEAKEDFLKMCNDIKNEGLSIRVVSSYRSYNYQENLYNRYVKNDGVEKADTYSARPGFSEHQTGLVIDVDNNYEDYNNFENTKEYEWMINNAYKYGFILRYPVGKEDITGYEYESWHYRYVGKEIAEYIYNNNITFDEYFVRFIDIDEK